MQALAVDNLASNSSEADCQRRRLIRTIEGEIIPRLLVSLSGSLAIVREGRHLLGTAEFTRLLLATRLLSNIGEREESDFRQLPAGLNPLKAAMRLVGEPVKPDSR